MQVHVPAGMASTCFNKSSVTKELSPPGGVEGPWQHSALPAETDLCGPPVEVACHVEPAAGIYLSPSSLCWHVFMQNVLYLLHLSAMLFVK